MADEVRKLAEKTQQAINQISVSIQAMQQEIEVIEHSSSEVSKIANNSGEKINEFYKVFEKMESHSHSLKEVFTQLSERLILSVTKLDHILYKSDVYFLLNAQKAKDSNKNPISRLLDDPSSKEIILSKIPENHIKEISDNILHFTNKATSCITQEITQKNSDTIMQNMKNLESKSLELLEGLKK